MSSSGSENSAAFSGLPRWFVELAAKPLCARTLRSLSLGRTACQSCPLRAHQRRRFAILHPGRNWSRKYSSVSTTVVVLQELLYQSALRYTKALKHQKARTIQKGQKMTRIADPQINFADIEFLTQGIDLDPILKRCPTSSDDQPKILRAGAPRSSARFGKPDTGRTAMTPSQVLRSLILCGSRTGLSGTQRANRRRVHIARFTGFTASASLSTTLSIGPLTNFGRKPCRPLMTWSLKPRRSGTGGRQETARRYDGDRNRYPSSNR